MADSFDSVLQAIEKKAHVALNADGLTDYVAALMAIRTLARTARGLAPVPDTAAQYAAATHPTGTLVDEPAEPEKHWYETRPKPR